MKIAGIDPATESGRKELKKQFPQYEVTVSDDGGITIKGRNLKESSLKSMLSEGDSLFNGSNFNTMEDQKTEAKSQVEKAHKLQAAAVLNPWNVLPQLIQLMGFRKQVAEEILATNDQQKYSQYLDVYDNYTEQIKKLLGM